MCTCVLHQQQTLRGLRMDLHPPPRAVPSVSVWPKECAGQGSWYLWACSATRAPMSALVLGALLPQMTLPSGQDSGRVLPASPYPYPGSEYDPPHFSPW